MAYWLVWLFVAWFWQPESTIPKRNLIVTHTCADVSPLLIFFLWWPTHIPWFQNGGTESMPPPLPPPFDFHLYWNSCGSITVTTGNKWRCVTRPNNSCKAWHWCILFLQWSKTETIDHKIPVWVQISKVFFLFIILPLRRRLGAKVHLIILSLTNFLWEHAGYFY